GNANVWFDIETWGENCDDACANDIPVEIPVTRSAAPEEPMAGDMLELFEVTSGNGTAQDDNFGWNISWTGDVNNDGVDDVIVGAPNADYGGNVDCGAAYIFFGYTGFRASNGKYMHPMYANVSIYGTAANGHLGWDVSDAGNVDGDSYDDVIIGEPDNSAGNAYIFNGQAWGSPPYIYTTASASTSIAGESAGDDFGASVSGAGNYDNSGNDDVIAGAPGVESGKGRAYVFFGDGSIPTTAATADLVLNGKHSNGNFGFSVSTADDVDASGGSEVIVGEPGEDRSFVFYGPVNNLAGTDWPVAGTVTGTYTNTQSSNDGYERIEEASVGGDAVVWSDDFETDKGWTGYGGTGEWERAAPSGLGGEHGNIDPTADHTPGAGTLCLGNDITGSGTYSGDYEDTGGTTYWITSPSIDLTGLTGINLRFWRYLNVENSVYDNAYIETRNGVTG
ncbi:MAG: FG-GAP repeat protein, partial [Thermoplasmata archaeon]|nr:FG-GAP repeat protein [Thermoplasmata archaeon]